MVVSLEGKKTVVASTFKSSVNVKTMGSPQRLMGKKELKDGEKALLGTVIGVANGIVKRANPNDPEKFFIGLKGAFEAVPDEGEAVGSSILFAPDAIHEKVAEQLARDAKAVSFAFEAYVVAGGTAGFTWEYRFLSDGDPQEEDILSSVRLLLKPKAVEQLEDHRKGKKAS